MNRLKNGSKKNWEKKKQTKKKFIWNSFQNWWILRKTTNTKKKKQANNTISKCIKSLQLLMIDELFGENEIHYKL